MVAVAPSSAEQKWATLSFPSTLYLQPILELLIAPVPTRWHSEVRLGLQEALVNAAKHGNQLDPAKSVLVRYSTRNEQFWWIISDQGDGFSPPGSCASQLNHHAEITDKCVGDCGRGLYLMRQIFDQVHWTSEGRELHLCKRIRRWARNPLLP
ncbi:MAG: anti-sigma regulatory factor [Cyanobacteria bacterium P01_H01_bin.119]